MKEKDRVLVIVPTYNERENIRKLLPEILEQDPRIDVLVIDDNSPDGTAIEVRNSLKKNKRIHLLERSHKMGLGTAYVTGFKCALQEGYNFIFEMDADFSHDPQVIPQFLEEIEDQDLVIGSRYIKGVNVVNWPISRLVLSYFANRYTHFITGLPIRDATSGFKCFRKEVLETIDLDHVNSDGYAFQIEINFKVWKKGFRLKEIPIIFVDRNVGVSKMNSRIIREAAWMVWKLCFQSIKGKI